MSHIFDFGISQEDASIEQMALEIKEGDNLLCISSAGEVPLNLLALNDIKIKAVDISLTQNHLVNLKLNTVRILEPLEAAKFLGFMEASHQQRNIYYKKVFGLLNKKEKLFWNQNSRFIENGIIKAARFEKYINKFNSIALRIIGRNNLHHLFECESLTEQEVLFDKKINSILLKKIFQIAFHPKLYKNRGVASEGLIYSKQRNVADFFFEKFKDFCCSTLAKQNYFLQFTFFNHVIYPEALPDYLSESGISRIRKNYESIDIETISYEQALEKSDEGQFNKFHLSNLGDWMDKGDYAKLLELIYKKSAVLGRINSRFIYYMHPVPDGLTKYFSSEDQLGKMLSKKDKYPFYGLAPIAIDKRQ